MSQKKSNAARSWRRFSATVGGWAVGILGSAGVVLLLLVLAGYFQPKVPAANGEIHQASSASGEWAEATYWERTRYETAVGAIEPVHQATVAAKILARVEELSVKSGQPVTAGETLIRLESEEFRAREQQGRAAKDAAAAQAEQAQSEFSRAEKLWANRAISQAEYEAAAARIKSATADLERSEQAWQEAAVMLSYAEIKAPFTGLIIDKFIEPGDIVSPGQPLLSLYDPGRMQLVAAVRESLAQELEVGQKLVAQLDALDHACEATISEIVPVADAATRSFEVKVTGPCPPGIYSGMFGRLQLPLSPERVLVVPATSVKRVGQLTMVEVQKGDQRARRSVEMGRRFGDRWEVLAGLRAGEKVWLPPAN